MDGWEVPSYATIPSRQKDNPLRMDLNLDFEKHGSCLGKSYEVPLFMTVLGACDYDTKHTCCWHLDHRKPTPNCL